MSTCTGCLGRDDAGADPASLDVVSVALALRDVHKRYGKTRALDGLSFEVPTGVLLGFLGPNGAGKTTTFRTILGLARPDRGVIEVLGMRVGPETNRIAKRVGAIVEEPGLYGFLSGRDNLVVAADTLGFGHGRIDGLLAFVELTGDADRKVAGYSKGMRQRLALAAALLGDPEMLFLDEPLDGLDPAGQSVLRDQLRRLVDEEGKTIVMSTHDLADVSQLADRVVVINRGKVVTEGTLEELTAGGDRVRVVVGAPDEARRVLAAAGFETDGAASEIWVTGSDGAGIVRALAEAGLYPSAVIPERRTLEEVFLRVTEESS